ncbi:hypothetical protein V493_03455 [Pseudogymnoascus sp. VKM F-4281 (FW-2241)]|nr:hypothetical protein V493_03455 [Pseudogymnoascus sp. VKM F-4281 (FW-2241)]
MVREAKPVNRAYVRRVYYRALREVRRSWKRALEQFFYERWRVRVRLEGHEALRLLEALRTGKMPGAKGPRFPNIYHQLVRQKPWLAKKWFWMLRREVEQGRLDIEHFYRIYARIVRPGDMRIAAVTLGVDVTSAVELGRLEVEPGELHYFLESACKYAANREVMITFAATASRFIDGMPLPRAPASQDRWTVAHMAVTYAHEQTLGADRRAAVPRHYRGLGALHGHPRSAAR